MVTRGLREEEATTKPTFENFLEEALCEKATLNKKQTGDT